MIEFTVKYFGHINERTRSEGFPEDVVIIGTYQSETLKDVASIISNELMALVHQTRGMIVQLDPAQIIDLKKLNVHDRVYVPMENIAYIRAEVSNMTAMPQLVETGETDKAGKPIKAFQTAEGKPILPS